VRNTVVRLAFHKRLWLNDPDCLILRENDETNLAQVHALLSVAALSGGTLIFSDPPEDLTAERVALLRTLLPPLPHAATPLDLLQSRIPERLALPLKLPEDAVIEGCDVPAQTWLIVALFNWTAQVRDVKLVLSPELISRIEIEGKHCSFHKLDFWSKKYTRLEGPLAKLTAASLAPRCCELLLLRRVTPGVAQFVGSDVHISGGLELSSWREMNLAETQLGRDVGRDLVADGYQKLLHVSLHTGGSPRQLQMWVYLPAIKPAAPPVLFYGKDAEGAEDFRAEATAVGADVWRISVPPACSQGTTFQVAW